MLLRRVSLGKKGQADQRLLWDHHFDGHPIAAIVRVVVVIPVADPIKLI
jgi:hypothetical protein